MIAFPAPGQLCAIPLTEIVGCRKLALRFRQPTKQAEETPLRCRRIFFVSPVAFYLSMCYNYIMQPEAEGRAVRIRRSSHYRMRHSAGAGSLVRYADIHVFGQ